MNTNQKSKSKLDSLFWFLSLVGYAIGDLCGISAGLKVGQVIRVHGEATWLVVLGGMLTAVAVAALVIGLVWLSTSHRDHFEQFRRITIQCVTGITIITVMFFLFVYRTSNMVAIKYVDASFKANAGAIVRLIPDKAFDEVLEEGEIERKEMVEALRQEMVEAQETYKNYVGNDLNYACTIVGGKKFSGDELEEIKDAYSEMGVKVSNARVVEAKISLNDGSDKCFAIHIPVIKVDCRWYLDMLNTPDVVFE